MPSGIPVLYHTCFLWCTGKTCWILEFLCPLHKWCLEDHCSGNLQNRDPAGSQPDVWDRSSPWILVFEHGQPCRSRTLEGCPWETTEIIFLKVIFVSIRPTVSRAEPYIALCSAWTWKQNGLLSYSMGGVLIFFLGSTLLLLLGYNALLALPTKGGGRIWTTMLKHI